MSKKRFVRGPWPEADTYEEAFQIQWDLMNPFDFHLHAFAEDPKIETAIQVMYKPAIGYAAYYWVSRLAGVTMPSFWVRLGGTVVDMAHLARAGLPFVKGAAAVTAPVIVSVTGAVVYEKAVNEPLRSAHGGADIDWYGPFASGFGTVV